MLNEDSSQHFPAFSLAFQRFKIVEDQIILSPLFLEFDISLEDLSILCFELVIMLGHFLRSRHLKLIFINFYIDLNLIHNLPSKKN